MLNYPVLSLSNANDFALDLNDFAIPHQDIAKTREENQQLIKNILLNLRALSNEKIAQIKLKKDLDCLIQTHAIILKTLEDLEKKIAENSKVKENIDQKKALNAKLLNLYQQNLGFRMEKVESSNVKEYPVSFFFDNLSKVDPQQICSLILVTDGLKYKVRSCQPHIDILDKLVLDLCKTNDIRNFVLKVRRKFYAIVNKEPVK